MGKSSKRRGVVEARKRTSIDERTGLTVEVADEDTGAGPTTDEETGADASADEGTPDETVNPLPFEVDESVQTAGDAPAEPPSAETVTPHPFELGEAMQGADDPQNPDNAPVGSFAVDGLGSATTPEAPAMPDDVTFGEPLSTAVFEDPPPGLPPDPPGTPPVGGFTPPTTSSKKGGPEKLTPEQRALAAVGVGSMIDKGLEKLLQRFIGANALTPQQFAAGGGGMPFDLNLQALMAFDFEHATVREFTMVHYTDATGTLTHAAFPGNGYSLPAGCALKAVQVLPATPGMSAFWQLSEGGLSLGGLQKPITKWLTENQELLRGAIATASVVWYLYQAWKHASEHPGTTAIK